MKQRKSCVGHKSALNFLDFSSRFLPGKEEAT
jgi:hypothetical protein